MYAPRARFVAVFAAVLALSVGRALADGASKNVYRQTLKSTAWLVVPYENGTGWGTGWVVDAKEKLLVTNHHVVEDRDKVYVIFPEYKDGRLVVERSEYKDNRGYRAKIIDTDVTRDLAVVQLI